MALSGPIAARRTVGGHYYGGLDGLRALAVAGVLLYHGGVSWAGGGFLGVEVFFVLSGFLITSLLVVEWGGSDRIALGAFWARRARRLLPALLCLVTVIGIYYALAGPSNAVPGLKADGIATLLYFGNWHQIVTQSSYFAATGPISPLQHTWSLAIEEQFYIFWPAVLFAVLWLAVRVTRRRSPWELRALLAFSVVGAIASAIEMALLFDGGRGLDRVYYGTDTRAFSLLAGASLAIALAALRRRPAASASAGIAGVARRVLGGASMIALLALVVMMRVADGSSAWMYPFGFVGLDLAVLVVIAAVVLHPTSPVGRIFSLRYLRAVGMISYGIYLWHFPLFLWLDQSSTGLSGTPLLTLRLAVTMLVSIASFLVIEQPVRRRQLPTWLIRSLAPVAAGGAIVALLVGAGVGAAALGAAATAPQPKSTAHLRGSDPPCAVTLKNTPDYGLEPLTPSAGQALEFKWLEAHKLHWSGQGAVTFHTCPPRRVLLVGDSIAFTLGVGVMDGEQNYGVEMANAGILGCAFTTKGQLQVSGVWQGQSAGCPNAVAQWARDERSINAQAVVVELGYRDEFDWRIDGRVEHLGQPSFDAYVEGQIDRYVQVLGAGGVKVILLSVPWARPPALPDGSPAPASTPARHSQINALLQAAARRYPGRVSVLDIDKVISPGNQYQGMVNGKLCRFDGIHLTIYCADLLQPDVLGAVRARIGS